MENIAKLNGSVKQARHGVALGYGSATGLTSVVLARKKSGKESDDNDSKVAETLLSLSVAHDKFLRSSNIRID